MCGILTIYKKEGLSIEDVESAIGSLKLIKHRGPDGEGLLLIDTISGAMEVVRTDDTPEGIEGRTIEEIKFGNQYNLLLGHRRLSIFDLSIRGHQPLFYKDLVIVFNGEIYNYIELREELMTKDYKFTTGTDTEVILAAYRCWGTDCFSRFNGMWSMVIYDFNTKELIISNDRFGVKPLFYMNEKDEFTLMSEPKQIMATPAKMKGINKSAVDVFMDLGYLFYNNETFFREVMRFPKASFCKFRPDTDQVSFEADSTIFYELPNTINTKMSEKEVLETFRRLLSDAVRIRLRSDVEWGISLSGGLDSTSIAFVAKEVLQHHNFTTFSVIGEKGSEGDESHFINLANEKLQSKNIQVNPVNNFDKETFLSHIYQIGSPVGSTSFFAQYIIKRAIKENGITVLLSGQGGDEILAGYHHHFFKYTTELFLKGNLTLFFKEIKQWSAVKGKEWGKVLKSAIEDVYLTKKTNLGLSKFNYPFQRKIFESNKLSMFLKLDMEMLQLPFFLQADDSYSMAFAVETRNPFLDYRLVDFAFQLPNHFKIRNGWQKWLLREEISEMPEEIRYRTDKKGFSTPMKSWINSNKNMLGSLADICDKEFPMHADKSFFKRAAMGAWIENFSESKVNKLK